MKKYSQSILIYFILISSTFAQGYVYNGVQFFNETKEYFKAPSKWTMTDIIILSSVAGASYGLMYADESVKNIAIKNGEDNNTWYYETARVFGEPYFSPILGTAFLISGSITQNEANRRLGFEILQSVFYTGITTGFVKIGFGRSRPYQNRGNLDFQPFSSLSDSDLSLPSGHTSLSFALFTTLSLNAKNNIIKAVYYIPALITGVSRIAYNKHWLSDVFLGAVIGYVTARFVHSLHENPQIDKTAIPQQSDLINFSIPLF